MYDALAPGRATRSTPRSPAARPLAEALAGRRGRRRGGPGRDHADARPQGPGQLPRRAQRRPPGPGRHVGGAAAARPPRPTLGGRDRRRSTVVGIVVVSHSRALARAAVGARRARCCTARRCGSRSPPGWTTTTFGTDAVAITDAIEAADSRRRRRRPDGPRQRRALRRARARPARRPTAREPGHALPGAARRGAVVAAVAAAGGAGRDEVAAEARAALIGKAGPPGRRRSTADGRRGRRPTPDEVVAAVHRGQPRTACTPARPPAWSREVAGSTPACGSATSPPGRPVPAASLAGSPPSGALRGHEVEVRASRPAGAGGASTTSARARRAAASTRPTPTVRARASAVARRIAPPADRRGPGGCRPRPGIGIGAGPARHGAAGRRPIPDLPSQGPGRRVAAARARRSPRSGATSQRIRARTAREAGERRGRRSSTPTCCCSTTPTCSTTCARRIERRLAAPRGLGGRRRRGRRRVGRAARPVPAGARGRRPRRRRPGAARPARRSPAPRRRGPRRAGRRRPDPGRGRRARPDAGRAASCSPSAAPRRTRDPGAGPRDSRRRRPPGRRSWTFPTGTPVVVDGAHRRGGRRPAPTPCSRDVPASGPPSWPRRGTGAPPAPCEPAVTRDGVDDRRRGEPRLGRPTRAPPRQPGADRAGLVRTEFLFLGRAHAPDVDEQERRLPRRSPTRSAGRRITLRTLDVGGDKPLPYLPTAAEANPFLGVRGHPALLDAPGAARRPAAGDRPGRPRRAGQT